MDSDDSDAESSDEDEDDGYGADLMGDEQDRAMLMAMTEIQREKILSERSEQREVRRARYLGNSLDARLTWGRGWEKNRLALKRRAKEVMQREKHEHSQKSSSKKAKQQAKEAERRAAKEARENVCFIKNIVYSSDDPCGDGRKTSDSRGDPPFQMLTRSRRSQLSTYPVRVPIFFFNQKKKKKERKNEF